MLICFVCSVTSSNGDHFCVTFTSLSYTVAVIIAHCRCSPVSSHFTPVTFVIIRRDTAAGAALTDVVVTRQLRGCSQLGL